MLVWVPVNPIDARRVLAPGLDHLCQVAFGLFKDQVVVLVRRYNIQQWHDTSLFINGES